VNKRLTRDDLKRIMNQELEQQEANRVATGTGNPFPAGEPGHFTGTALIRLRVADVDPYEDNPRQTPNAKFQEIKDSIRARGLDQRLVVTKRPGTQRYILAKGGKTRLQALKELAAEENIYEAIDFELVNYQSESELLVAHMVENHQHEGMTFWDTAHGFLLLRAKRSKELQRSVSSREFSDELKALGFKIDNQTLGEYEFLHSVLKPLDQIAKAIGASDVRNTLRPQFSALAEISVKLSATEKERFEGQYAQWLQDFAATQMPTADIQGVDDQPSLPAKFNTSVLVQHLNECAAEFLDLSDADLAAAQAALSKDRKIDGASLRTAIEQARISAASPALPAITTRTASLVDTLGEGAGTGEAPGAGLDAGDGFEEGASSGFNAGTYGDSSAAGAGGHGDQEDQDDATGDQDDGVGSARPRAAGSGSNGRVPDGLSGVTAVPKSLLHTLIPLDANGKPINQDAGTANASDTGMASGVQGDLPGTTTLEQAYEAFCEAVDSLCHFAGIQALLRPAPGMPLTYFVDTPERPLGDDPADYAVQAWWFLANLFGQITQHFYNFTGQDTQGQTIYALYDTGPSGFRQLAADEEGFMAYVQSHLGGAYQTEAFFMLNILSDPTHAMSPLAMEVVRTASVWRMHRGD